MPGPLVSVCVPTRNRAEALRHALPEILRQDYTPFEVLVSDNGSTDETQTLCQELASRDKRVRYIRHSKNIGLYGNHNFCLDEARGEYLCFFHDHDERQRGLIREYVTFLDTHPEAGVVCADWELIDETGRPMGVRAYGTAEITEGLTYIDQTLRSGRSSVATPGAMIRREALGEIRFDEQGAIGFGDFPVWFRMAETHAVGHISKILWRWRQSTDAQSARTIESMAEDYARNLFAYCDGHLARWPAHRRRVERWRRDIRRYLFWALAYEVGLYFRKDRSAPRLQNKPTVFEIFNYRLDPQAFERTLEQMKRYRGVGPVERATDAAIRLLQALRATAPLSWATRHATLFRNLLGLKE